MSFLLRPITTIIGQSLTPIQFKRSSSKLIGGTIRN